VAAKVIQFVGAARAALDSAPVGRMTPCAHRLREPNRTLRPLTPSVAATALTQKAPIPSRSLTA
jgi:hypothetical protein